MTNKFYNLALVVVVALAVTTCRADPYSDAVLALNPLYYWRLADQTAAVGPGMSTSTGSGTSFGQTAVAPLTTDAGSTSFSGGGIRTPGTVDRYPPGSTGYTTCFWANFDVSPPPDFRSIVGDGNNAGHWYMMVYLSPFGKIRTHNYPGIYDSVSTVTTGQDYFICTMWDQAAGKIRFYINGALDSEQSTTTAAPNVARSTTGKMYIGADDRVPGVSGRIDEVSFFNRPLSPTEIASLYAPPTQDPAVAAFCDNIQAQCTAMDDECTTLRSLNHIPVPAPNVFNPVNRHMYRLVIPAPGPGQTYAQFRAAAQAIGAGWDLATFSNMDEFNFVKDTLVAPHYAGAMSTLGYQGYVVGAQDSVDGWKWIDGSPVPLSFFGGSEPNDHTTYLPKYPNAAMDNRFGFKFNDYLNEDYCIGPTCFVTGFVAEKHTAEPNSEIPDDCDTSVAACNDVEAECRDKASTCPLA